MTRHVEALIQGAAKAGHADLAEALLGTVAASAGAAFQLRDGKICPRERVEGGHLDISRQSRDLAEGNSFPGSRV